MSTDDKLQKAYQEMVEQVRELMTQEGKGLQEAMNLAKERLQSWQELTSSEAEKVSRELHRDLDSLGRTLRESKEAFRQQWENDAQYAKSKFLDTLSLILEKANDGLAKVNELLENSRATEEHSATDTQKEENNTEITPAPSHQLLLDEESVQQNEHQDHRQWQSEHALWQDEIEIWKKEDARARKLLEEVQAGIDHLEEQMDDHALALRAHELVAEDHEAVLAEEGHNDVVHHDIHEEERSSHEEQRTLHESIKDRHRQAMALLEKLHKVLA